MAVLELRAYDLTVEDLKISDRPVEYGPLDLKIGSCYEDSFGIPKIRLEFSLEDDGISHAFFRVEGVEDITQLMAYCHTALALHAGGHLE